MQLHATDEDVVFVEGLTVQTVIGLYKWERTILQPVVIDLLMYSDVQQVADQNSLSQGVNYKAVCDDVTQWTTALQAELVEELAEHLAKQLLDKYNISKLTIKVGKPAAITETSLVGVQITRRKN